MNQPLHLIGQMAMPYLNLKNGQTFGYLRAFVIFLWNWYA